ncbi:MAG: pectin acetylesterase-family hydrolase [Pseudohongiellaceae bacterium]
MYTFCLIPLCSLKQFLRWMLRLRDLPVVQVDSDFYHVTLVPSGENWRVSTADTLVSPNSISARFVENQLKILSLNYEDATYEVNLALLETADESVLFQLVKVVDITATSNCAAGITPDVIDSSEGFDPLLQLTKFEIKNSISREERCNDGSPAVFYFRPSQTKSKNWKIHLQVGGDCSTEADCQLRASVTAETVAGNAQLDFDEVFLPFTSSLEYPDTLDLEGIFSLNLNLNPEFGTYNHVFIPYCSSDSHYGDRNADEGSFGFYFKDKKIVSAVIEDLLDSSVIGDNNLQVSELVVVSGTSAGGRGVQQNLDRVAKLIPHENVRGVLDSSYFTRYFLTNEERIGLALRQSNLWNGQYDDSCVSFIGEEDKHLCDRVELISDTIDTPVFIYMDQLDEVALGSNTAASAEFAVHIRDELQTLCGVFSGQFGFHGALHSDTRFFESTIDGLSYHDVLRNWLAAEAGTVKTLITDGPESACQ